MKVAHFSNIYYHTTFHDPTIHGTCQSHLRSLYGGHICISDDNKLNGTNMASSDMKIIQTLPRLCKTRFT
jgi:hypothetical protein